MRMALLKTIFNIERSLRQKYCEIDGIFHFEKMIPRF